MKTATGSLAQITRFLSLVLLLLLVGCAAPAPSARSADFPVQSADQFFYFRWALERDGGIVRAVGLVESRVSTFSELTLVLFGLDKSGRVVSRGFGYVTPGFRREAQPFTVDLRPGGQEDRFELKVLSFSLPNLRGGQ